MVKIAPVKQPAKKDKIAVKAEASKATVTEEPEDPIKVEDVSVSKPTAIKSEPEPAPPADSTINYTVIMEKDHSFGNIRSRVTVEIEAPDARTEKTKIETMMKAAVDRHRVDWPDAISVRLWNPYGNDQIAQKRIVYAADGCGWAGDKCTGKLWPEGNIPKELKEWGRPSETEKKASKERICRQDIQCWGDKHSIAATFACQPLIDGNYILK